MTKCDFFEIADRGIDRHTLSHKRNKVLAEKYNPIADERMAAD